MPRTPAEACGGRAGGCRDEAVADASIFPTSLGVNPHWTVMALAELAAVQIATT